jgi:hypothetical protein
MEWLIAFSISIPIMLIFLLIPSIVSIYKVGIKEYFKKWKIISMIRSGLNLSYYIEENKTYNYIYTNGKVQSVTNKQTDYYYPIFNNVDVIIIQSRYFPFSEIFIIFNHKVDGKWVENTTELKTSCPYQQLFIDSIKKKLIKLRVNSVKMESVNKLEEAIYSNLLERDRDNKINLILND